MLEIQNREGIVPRWDALPQREVEVLADELGLRGFVHALLRNGDGEIKQELILPNGITQVGNQYYADRAANIGTPPGQVTGMKLGTSTTAFATTGGGAQLGAYISGSHAAITGGFPTGGAGGGTSRRITWKSSWAAGVATNSAIAEAVLINEALADATTLAAFTIARLVLSPVVNKGTNDTFDLTWQHDLGT